MEKELPVYKCHKKVHALKIKDIRWHHPNNHFILPEEEGYSEFYVEPSYVTKHNPHIGGYFVVYEDGYKSFSPAKDFEEGYTKE